MQQAAQTRTRANFTDAQWAAIQEESARISQSINSGDMFGGLGTVLTIAAMALQPELAGMLAGGTATLGSSIAAGALIGAGTSVINGGDPLKGALTGGIGGAIGSFASGLEGGANFVGPVDPSAAIAGVQTTQLVAGAVKAGTGALINGGSLGDALTSAALNAGANVAGNTVAQSMAGSNPALTSAAANAAGTMVGSGGNLQAALISGVAGAGGQIGAGVINSAATPTTGVNPDVAPYIGNTPADIGAPGAYLAPGTTGYGANYDPTATALASGGGLTYNTNTSSGLVGQTATTPTYSTVNPAATPTATVPTQPNQALASAIQTGLGSALTQITASSPSATTPVSVAPTTTPAKRGLNWDGSGSGIDFGWLTAGMTPANLDANGNPTFVPMGG